MQAAVPRKILEFCSPFRNKKLWLPWSRNPIVNTEIVCIFAENLVKYKAFKKEESSNWIVNWIELNPIVNNL